MIMMGDLVMDFDEPPNEDCIECSVLLMKDQKVICQTKCLNPPIQIPTTLSVSREVRLKAACYLVGLPQFFLLPACEDAHQEKEWKRFLFFLYEHERVAIAASGFREFYIHPPIDGAKLSHFVVSYRRVEKKKQDLCSGQNRPLSDCSASGHSSSQTCLELQEVYENMCRPEYNSRGQAFWLSEKNYVRASPSYLKTLGQAHSGWIFGAIAELIDNSKDAKSTKLQISIETIYSKVDGKDIPMLSVIDDGHGMSHKDVVRMITFGHEQPDVDDPDHIGRFGVGFKTGAMRIGKDALVLTQTASSRSVAFLSQSLNEGKENLEIPIVSYQRREQYMEVDMEAQTESLANHNLESIKKFSPFNEYLIGEKASLFSGKGTGTQIYIWNLDKWGSNYCLEWNNGMSGESSFHQGDILIRSKRARARPGQMSRTVPLDYSLRSYLELIFLNPRMKIYVQGSLVRSRPLAKSLNRTVVENGSILGRPVQLTLGRSQLEREQGNCGIFLYWHGRLLEAYKRVGSMIHNGDVSHGIIGVVDVTTIMGDANGHVWVHSNKQGFQDCEVYSLLEDWLGEKADEYVDKNCEKIQLRKFKGFYNPDNEWVQCDKCRKWRMLSPGFDVKTLPQEWFCYMKPFSRSCEIAEQKAGRGVFTISAKRS